MPGREIHNHGSQLYVGVLLFQLSKPQYIASRADSHREALRYQSQWIHALLTYTQGCHSYTDMRWYPL